MLGPSAFAAFAAFAEGEGRESRGCQLTSFHGEWLSEGDGEMHGDSVRVIHNHSKEQKHICFEIWLDGVSSISAVKCFEHAFSISANLFVSGATLLSNLKPKENHGRTALTVFCWWFIVRPPRAAGNFCEEIGGLKEAVGQHRSKLNEAFLCGPMDQSTR